MRNFGNLAVTPQTKPKTRSVTRRVIRKKGLPLKEKLLYLGTIIFFVLVTSWVLAQQAELTKLDYEIQQKETEITQLEADMASLDDQSKALLKPDRIIGIAESLGMTYDPDRIRTSQKTTNNHP